MKHKSRPKPAPNLMRNVGAWVLTGSALRGKITTSSHRPGKRRRTRRHVLTRKWRMAIRVIYLEVGSTFGDGKPLRGRLNKAEAQVTFSAKRGNKVVWGKKHIKNALRIGGDDASWLGNIAFKSPRTTMKG